MCGEVTSLKLSDYLTGEDGVEVPGDPAGDIDLDSEHAESCEVACLVSYKSFECECETSSTCPHGEYM